MARGIEGEDSLDGNIHGGHVEGLEHDLGHLLPVIPVGDDSMLNGVLEGKDTSLRLSLISNIGILLSHTDHHTLVARTANNGGEHCSGSVISSKSSLAHAGAIVNNKSSNVFVTHLHLVMTEPLSQVWSTPSCELPM